MKTINTLDGITFKPSRPQHMSRAEYALRVAAFKLGLTRWMPVANLYTSGDLKRVLIEVTYATPDGVAPFTMEEAVNAADSLCADIADDDSFVASARVVLRGRNDPCDVLAETLHALEEAQLHIRGELQPEFSRLARGERLTFPWNGEYDEAVAAQRLATWWHGCGTDEVIERARAALGRRDQRLKARSRTAPPPIESLTNDDHAVNS